MLHPLFATPREKEKGSTWEYSRNKKMTAPSPSLFQNLISWVQVLLLQGNVVAEWHLLPLLKTGGLDCSHQKSKQENLLTNQPRWERRWWVTGGWMHDQSVKTELYLWSVRSPGTDCSWDPQSNSPALCRYSDYFPILLQRFHKMYSWRLVLYLAYTWFYCPLMLLLRYLSHCLFFCRMKTPTQICRKKKSIFLNEMEWVLSL